MLRGFFVMALIQGCFKTVLGNDISLSVIFVTNNVNFNVMYWFKTRVFIFVLNMPYILCLNIYENTIYRLFISM